MNPEKQTGNPHESDHGEVVGAPHVRRVWAWIFPALAALAGLWILWSSWQSKGPEIEIRFKEAPGIQAGKTLLIYRGVTSGHVTGVRLGQNLDDTLVTVRLKAFAANLANKNTDFWIDQPVLSLRETSGLESIIQGNSIQARLGGGPPTLKFQGLSQAPLTPLDDPSLIIKLSASDIPFLARNTPVYHKGVPVGLVCDKEFDADGKPFLQVIINEKHAGLVLDTSRFWIIPATSFKLSARGASLDMAGLAALFQGGITFDSFSPGGKPASDNAEFCLAPGESAARADGPRCVVSFEEGVSLVPGESRITCLGQPVGLVESVTLAANGKTIEAAFRLESAFSGLATSGAVFTLIQPQISLKGISGLNTLLTGPRIALEPGPGAPATRFAGYSEQEGIQVILTADKLPAISEGAPVYHRGLVAGTVLAKFPNAEGRPSLRVAVHRDFCSLLRANSRFWRVPATSVAAGPGVLNVELQGIASLVQGSIAFDVFGAPGAPATNASAYQLFDNEKSASATSPPIRVTFENGQGLLAGKTELRYLGVPVGLVETVRATQGKVEVVARLQPGHDPLRRKGSTFAIVQPKISLQGFSGIETLISGVYIECVPGGGDALADSFVGTSTALPEILEHQGFEIRLSTPTTAIRPGAQISYRDIIVGEIVAKKLSDDESHVVLTAGIDPSFRHLIRENSRFWEAGDLGASIGFLKLKIHSPALIAADGRIAFSNPEKIGAPAKAGHVFELGRKPFR